LRVSHSREGALLSGVDFTIDAVNKPPVFSLIGQEEKSIFSLCNIQKTDVIARSEATRLSGIRCQESEKPQPSLKHKFFSPCPSIQKTDVIARSASDAAIQTVLAEIKHFDHFSSFIEVVFIIVCHQYRNEANDGLTKHRL